MEYKIKIEYNPSMRYPYCVFQDNVCCDVFKTEGEAKNYYSELKERITNSGDPKTILEETITVNGQDNG